MLSSMMKSSISSLILIFSILGTTAGTTGCQKKALPWSEEPDWYGTYQSRSHGQQTHPDPDAEFPGPESSPEGYQFPQAYQATRSWGADLGNKVMGGPNAPLGRRMMGAPIKAALKLPSLLVGAGELVAWPVTKITSLLRNRKEEQQDEEWIAESRSRGNQERLARVSTRQQRSAQKGVLPCEEATQALYRAQQLYRAYVIEKHRLEQAWNRHERECRIPDGRR